MNYKNNKLKDEEVGKNCWQQEQEYYKNKSGDEQLPPIKDDLNKKRVERSNTSLKSKKSTESTLLRNGFHFFARNARNAPINANKHIFVILEWKCQIIRLINFKKFLNI